MSSTGLTTQAGLTIAVALGRAAGRASRLLRAGSGGSIAGRVARVVDGDILARLTDGRCVVLVTGTNGKTTTTAYVTAALATRGPVTSNIEGNNLLDGLVSALLVPADRSGPVVLEVDEAVLPVAIEQSHPALVILLNLSRDQLDRHHEVRSHLSRWGEALGTQPKVLVVANADDPLVVAAVLAGRPNRTNVVWVSAGSAWRADARLCPICGNALSGGASYACTSCGFRRPQAGWQLTDRGLDSPDGRHLPVGLSLPGEGNRSNAALGVAAVTALGVEPGTALEAMSRIEVVQDRYRHFDVDGRRVELRLAKNPAGWVDSLAMLTGDDASLILAINARVADGADPSWLWDVPFERLTGSTVTVTGERRHDLAVRLLHAEVDCATASDIADALADLPPGRVVVIANYTAFQQARTWLTGAAA